MVRLHPASYGDSHASDLHDLTGRLRGLSELAVFDTNESDDTPSFSGLEARVTGERDQEAMRAADRLKLVRDGFWTRLFALKKADDINFHALKAAFDRLPPDEHILDEDREHFSRRRSYGGFMAAMIGGRMCVHRLPHVAYTPWDVERSTQYRAGELDSRLFDPHEEMVLENGLFQELIAAGIDRQSPDLFDAFVRGRLVFEVKTQLFEIETVNGTGWITPEGRPLCSYSGFEHMSGTEMGERRFHRDSEQGVTIWGMGTVGSVNAPLSHIADPVTGKIHAVSANQPGRAYGMDDSRVLHTVDDLVGEGGRRVVITNITPFEVRDAVSLLDNKYGLSATTVASSGESPLQVSLPFGSRQADQTPGPPISRLLAEMRIRA